MTERDMRFLDGLDIRKIDRNGRYIDVTIPLIFNLDYEQVKYLRWKYRSNEIAINMKDDRPVLESMDGVRRNNSSQQRRYVVSREQKYNTGRCRTKEPVRFNPIGKIIVGALVISLAVGVFLHNGIKISDKSDEVSIEVTNDKYVVSNKAANTAVTGDNIEEGYDVDDTITYDTYVVDENGGYEESVAVEDMVNGEIISELCDIYHVNFSVVYDFIKDRTDNFTKESYLNGIIDGVTCKGDNVVADSERELLVYTVRCLKQLPGQLGIETSNLYSNSSYQSGNDYMGQITKVCNDLGLNRCLMYAIIYSETNFNSDLFINANNPAGLRIDGKWWHFDTKEEGFYELGMEMLKYYRMIGISPSEVNNNVIEQIRDIHAPLSDGNEFWLPNVIENYEYAMANEAELFNDNIDRTITQ